MIEDYSNPKIVFQRAKRIFGDDVQIKLSTRKDKKYMFLNPETNRWAHFGFYGMQDYTKHKDKLRRDKFRMRNKKWSYQEPYTSGYLSYVLLW